MGSPEDRRRSPRVPIELRVDYKKMNTFFADYTKNISKGGTFIKTDKPLPVGTGFLFKLVVPQLPEPVALRGEVMWIQAPGDPMRPDHPDPGMGIRFIYDSDDHRRGFEAHVEQLMRASLGDALFERLMARAREEEEG